MSQVNVSYFWNESVPKHIVDVFKQALVDGAEHILAESQKEIEDVEAIDTGTMMRSGTVNKEEAPGLFKVTVSYNTPYAMMVHEGTGIYGPQGKPIEIRAVNKKVLAVPYRDWAKRVLERGWSGSGQWLNPYGSGRLPMLSKDGRFVILGKKVTVKGVKGRKFLERPFNREKDKVAKLAQLRVAAALRRR